MHVVSMSQFNITQGTFEKEITHCGKFSAHLLLPASLQKKRCKVSLAILDKNNKVLDHVEGDVIPAICGTSCHIKIEKKYIGKIAKGLITLDHKEK